MCRRILLEMLANVRFLDGVPMQHLEDLVDIARVEEYEEGEILFTEGQPVEAVYLIVDGDWTR